MMHTILYTANIRGELDLLPRLYTFIKELRSRGNLSGRPPFDRADHNRFLLLDLGHSCAPEVWHCSVTGGRSALLVLDAMGFHAARTDLDAASRERLRGNLLGLALLDDEHPRQENDILITAHGRGEPPVRPCTLHIVLAPANETRLDGRTLLLAGVEQGQIGVAQVSDEPALLHHAVHDLPAAVLPDPTITAAVDFVLSEARQAQRKNSR